MADKKITQLDALTELASGDLFVVVDSVDGTPISKKITAANVASYINSLVAAGVTTLNGLDDVTITSASSGQLLSYNGSAWVNSAPTGSFNPIEAAVFL
jgi:hypothetical protein